MRRNSTKITGVWLGILALAGPLRAQIGGSGSIQGVVSDPSGAVIPGAIVTATNRRPASEDHAVDHRCRLLHPFSAAGRRYSVTVSAPGFQVLTQENLVVDALGSVGFNAVLKVGAAGEQVTVTDSPPALNTVRCQHEPDDSERRVYCSCRWPSAPAVRPTILPAIPPTLSP